MHSKVNIHHCETEYSSGNCSLKLPVALTFGSVPAFGMTFQDSVRVTFLFALKVTT